LGGVGRQNRFAGALHCVICTQSLTGNAMLDTKTPATNHLLSASKAPIAPNNSHLDAQESVTSDEPHRLYAASLFASALLAACGGGGGGGEPAGVPGGSGGPGGASSGAGGGTTPGGDGGVVSAPGFNNNPSAKADNEAARFLQQSQFASTPAEIATVRGTSYAGYLQQQFAKPLRDTGWDWLESRQYGANATLDKYVYNTAIADCMLWRDLFSAPDAMRKRCALALSEFFVVSLNSMEIDWRGYAVAAYWDFLNKHAFGNFRDLLQDVTLSPAMGYFLNTRGNKKANRSGRLPDENYAREVMQLFTIGLYELNLDGSVKVDSAGKRRETYTAADVSQLARVFTGFDFDSALHPYDTGNGIQFPGADYKVWPRAYARNPMTFKQSDHSPEEIRFLQTTIAANTPADRAVKTALDALFNHPNVGPFFGRQMIQRLVTSDPSPEYVARVASAFNNNGAGVRGDMKAVWTAILLDDEARGAGSLSDPFFGKLREPMLRLTQWARSFGVTSKTGSWKIYDLSEVSYNLGQSPFHSPSVFNYFRPGYVPPGTTLASNAATAPEFQLVNETTVGSYVNYMQYVIRDGMYTFDKDGPEIKYENGGREDIVPDYSNWLALINNSTINDAEAQRVAQALVARLNLTLTAGQLAATSVATITAALKAAMLQNGRSITNAQTPQMDGYRRDLLAAAIFMIMASPDYLIQK
jgi:uncharacterized protein (DUF1800 family)